MRLWRLMAERAEGQPVGMAHLCWAAIVVVGVTGAAVTVTLQATPRETLYATDQLAAHLEDLALTLGEGPGIDASDGDATLVADLLATESMSQWPMFAGSATAAGIRAVFALPLRVGAIRLGVLDLFRTTPGGLVGDQLADALLLADTACGLLLDAAERDHDRPSGVAPEVTRPPHPEVHQATGMLSVQLGVTAAIALIRLRAYAYSHERPLHDVARDVVGRRLRFDREGTEDGGHHF